ncbi:MULTISPECIES: helix-turn-helix domain-containing protein [unclassified Nitratiruptor]|uniref:helix-turn-helix domain-containing protein n=1 Tax=unclassified Nitratiruptor TaxID=2624044 RepID=UPI001915B3F7|nr:MULTISPECIES: helix-turn-helix domain-containing protein [unclassified Nitratiruptor]
MECEVYDHCVLRKECDTCPTWYQSYVKACKERGVPATQMKRGSFTPMDVTPSIEGDDMTKQEAAKELGVSVATVTTYLSQGRLKSDGNGNVVDESVEEYKQKRDENLKALKEKNQPKETETFEEAMKQVEQVKPHRKGMKLIDLDTFEAALKAAYQQGRAEALKELESETITLDDVLGEYIPKLKEGA